jgi:putative flavoprotein involved in K+ transport
MDFTKHENVVDEWLAAFAAALDQRNIDRVLDLFEPKAFWRDLATFTWNIYTAEGRDAIRAMLTNCLDATAPTAWTVSQLLEPSNGLDQAVLSFETKVARCSAVLRLRGGRCWTLLTSVAELKGFEETIGARRPNGAPLKYERGRVNWKTKREQQKAEIGMETQPYCVVVGAGIAGLSLGARLKQLAVPTLIIDKRERPSDTWRQRYATLSLHSPVWYDQMPYLPFPETWPRFAPKDQVADWLDAYAKIMDLDIWTGAECAGSRYDEVEKEWRLSVVRDGRSIELRPKQLVFASGFFDAPSIPQIKGQDLFRGKQFHVSDLQGLDDCEGLRSVVIGAGTSGHDVSAQLWEAGSQVTMIQRSPTLVTRIESLLPAVAIYNTDTPGPKLPVDLADLLLASIPNRLMPQFQAPVVAAIKAQDQAFYEGLRKAGFLYDFGADGGGFFSRGTQDPSGFYIDVGASELIIDGRIAVRSGVSVEAIRERSVVLSDGAELPADVIVYATGYTKFVTLSKVLPEDIIRKLGPVGGIGSGVRSDHGPSKGETRNIWKPTRQPGLWLHNGNFGLMRFFSRLLALQIKARHVELTTPVYGLDEPGGHRVDIDQIDVEPAPGDQVHHRHAFDGQVERGPGG